MDLHIDTSHNPLIKLQLKKEEIIILEESFEAKYLQAEKLLVSIEKLLERANVNLNEIRSVFVAENGDSFSALRIGVITANSLAFALNIPINNKVVPAGGFGVVCPIYDRNPNITIAKKLDI